MRVTMLVFGDLTYDFRVFREARTLAAAGHRVSLVAGDLGAGSLPAAWDAFEIHRRRVDRGQSLRRSYPAYWRWARRVTADLRPEVIHAHDLDSLWPAARVARRRGVPLVYDTHELFTEQSSLTSRPGVRGFWRWLEARHIHDADHVVTVSPPIAAALRDRYRLATTPTVLRNLPPWRPARRTDHLRRALGLVGDPAPLALYQGGFLTDNGLAEVIAAMHQVDAGRLVLLGGGPTEAALRQQVEDENLGDRVHFLPRVPFPQLHAWTCGADVGLCVIKPTGDSFAWSLPNKLFEYFIAGLPVVAGDTPAIRQVMDDTGAGICVEPTDPGRIAAGLQALLSDARQRRTRATAARRAAQRFCWEREAPRLLAAYASLSP